MDINKNINARLIRRKLLRNTAILTGSTFAIPFSPLLSAQVSSQTPAVATRKLSNKALFIQGPNSNVLALDSTDGIIMIDGGHADWFTSLQQALSTAFPSRPVKALFNTHWHREQTGSNEAMGKQGVEIFAHENTKLWLSTPVWQRWSDITFEPLPEVALPKTLYLDSESIQIAEHTIQLEYLWNAHTDGDLAVYFEQENLLVCGGLVSNGRWPIIDWWTGGYTGGMLDSFLALLSLANQDTRIIPAYGDIMNLAQLKAQNKMYVTIIERIQNLFIKSYSLQEILAAKPTAEYDAEMGDPTQFISLAFQSLQGHLRDPQNFRLLNIP